MARTLRVLASEGRACAPGPSSLRAHGAPWPLPTWREVSSRFSGAGRARAIVSATADRVVVTSASAHLGRVLEPRATAIALLVVGIVLAACVLSTRLAARTGVPVFLVFVLLGLAAGEEGIGGIAFDDYGMAFRVG